MTSWDNYYEKNQGRPLRPLYIQAVAHLNPEMKVAMDLGCGDGSEVLDLLKRGFQVHAVDQETKSIERVKAQALAFTSQLYPHVSALESWKSWPQVDFLFSFHALPFCSPDGFDQVVLNSFSSVKADGILAISFFGPEDDWVKAKRTVGISVPDLKSRLGSFEILSLNEILKKGPTAFDGEKMWNVIEVIARRS